MSLLVKDTEVLAQQEVEEQAVPLSELANDDNGVKDVPAEQEEQPEPQDVNDAKQEEKVVDIDMSEMSKKRFRIDGDNNRWIELDTTDMEIVKRLRDIYPKLNKLAEKALAKLGDQPAADESDEETVNKFADALVEIDNEMRALVDKLFGSEVSRACVPAGTMYALFNGKFRFEIVIEKLTKLYETDLTEEFARMNARIKKHTNKYTGKR